MTNCWGYLKTYCIRTRTIHSNSVWNYRFKVKCEISNFFNLLLLNGIAVIGAKKQKLIKKESLETLSYSRRHFEKWSLYRGWAFDYRLLYIFILLIDHVVNWAWTITCYQPAVWLDVHKAVYRLLEIYHLLNWFSWYRLNFSAQVIVQLRLWFVY